MALAPHWIDEVLSDCRDVDSVLAAIAKSTKFRAAVEQGISDANAQEETSKSDPACGPSYEQVLREAIVNVVNDSD